MVEDGNILTKTSQQQELQMDDFINWFYFVFGFQR